MGSLIKKRRPKGTTNVAIAKEVIGEVIEPLPPRDLTVTLFVPPLHVPTPAVYRAWDATGGGHHASGNDLTDAAIIVEPGLARWRDAIAEATGQVPVLAGSGATWFLE
ncbi:MAG: hypothetical protein ACKOFT_02005, partial [Actinomycetota bacterium]